MSALRRCGLMLFLALFYGLSWLALWTISFYLNDNGQQAALLLPQGLRLALLILLTRRYWPVIIGVETALLFWLHTQQLQTQWVILVSVWVSLLPAWLTHSQWHRYTLYWQRLLLLLIAVSLNSLLQMALPGAGLPSPLTHTLLASLTGGVLLIPFIYLIYEYLKQQHLQNLLAQNLSNPPLRTSLLVWCSLFFSLAVGVQISLSPDVERLLLIVVFLPNVVMAYAFGWQGGVLAAILGSLLITITRQMSGAFHDIIELELFLSTQALLGIGLGIAISRQQQLAQRLNRYRQRLEQELNRRRQLMQRLVSTEEEIRKDIARELHDDIGQNITAIQIQAAMITRRPEPLLTTQAAAQITQLAQRVHHTTRQLLRQLRPPVLNEMSLEKALHHLADEFAFAQRGIDFRLDYRLPQPPTDDTVVFTLYRLVQELLNNISKHANARRVRVRLTPLPGMLMLEVKDNGIGIPEQVQEGFGLRGIEERVHALGGEWMLQRRKGTRIIVKLPTNLP
ncbi:MULTISPECIES: MASE1 domain-containing protein [unclassified Symbiopectobacterium]|uniref:MASE1 domain-containing sensor histidine kinase n=1 Tax=unclassified Symbiopectobacterium TaxID=2794573 RepID=UPI002227E8AF|nr:MULTISPECIES: MASE1 domain-containing protein [unclassified Symbiopectobacterium]MCW2476766.1 MASE1 domain-containing protein [Candidatus Symbiopectobacterium sp. NZEC151]MCW2487988.1 MASE1 domain-containing protein [Candidatus Symbiopectobacterium sp. NZEC127]